MLLLFWSPFNVMIASCRPIVSIAHTHHTAFIRGRTKDLGDFTLEVGISQAAAAATGGSKRRQAPLSVSYWGGPGVLLADVKGRLEEETRRAQAAGGSDDEASAKARASQRGTAATAGALPDTVMSGSNVVVLRVAAVGPFTVDAVLRRATAEELAAVEEEDEDYEPGTEDVGKVRGKGIYLTDSDSVHFRSMCTIHLHHVPNRPLRPA